MEVLMRYSNGGVAVRFELTELHFFCRAAEKLRYHAIDAQHVFEMIKLELGCDGRDVHMSAVAALAGTALDKVNDDEGDTLELFATQLSRILAEAKYDAAPIHDPQKAAAKAAAQGGGTDDGA